MRIAGIIFSATAMLGLSSPAFAQTGEMDLISACAGILATMRALPAANGNPQSEQSYIAGRDNMAGVWASSSDAESLNQRLASDAAYWTANPDNGSRLTHANKVISDVNDCMIRRRLVQIEQEQQRAQQQQQAQREEATRRIQAQHQAMAAPPERPATPRRTRTRETPPGATQKLGRDASADDKDKDNDKPKKAQIANQCVGLIKDPQLYGGFVNTCDFPVYIAWCAYHPKKGAWSEAFDCDRDKGGLGSAAAHASDAEHTHNAERIFWFACRKDATPKVKYTSGSGFYGHCE